VRILLDDGTDYVLQKKDYLGYFTRPMFLGRGDSRSSPILAEPQRGSRAARAIIELVRRFELHDVASLTTLLAGVRTKTAAAGTDASFAANARRGGFCSRRGRATHRRGCMRGARRGHVLRGRSAPIYRRRAGDR